MANPAFIQRCATLAAGWCPWWQNKYISGARPCQNVLRKIWTARLNQLLMLCARQFTRQDMPVLLELQGCARGGEVADLLRAGLANERQLQVLRPRVGRDLECARPHHRRRPCKAQRLHQQQRTLRGSNIKASNLHHRRCMQQRPASAQANLQILRSESPCLEDITLARKTNCSRHKMCCVFHCCHFYYSLSCKK